LGNQSADHVFPRPARSDTRASSESSRRKSSRARVPSSAGYLIIAGAIAVALFFGLWWMLVSGGDEAPWVPAGLAASVVLLVALSAREVVMRRAWTRYLLEQDKHGYSSREINRKSVSSKNMHSTSLHSAALRAIQKQSAEADSTGAATESHLEVFHICQDYLTSTDEALRSSSLTTESRLAIRGGQEKVRSLQKHHMLIWARDGSRALTHEAQQRARTSDKIETANRAMDCLDSALKVYPDEPELEQSKLAIREFIASVKVAHWVELAERSAFKGHYRRAIERYKDALFYLNRETVKEELRTAGAERIGREIELLRAHVRTAGRTAAAESSENKGSDETDDVR
jgi:tetratricopeptide (TPR) repeat protein